MRELLFLITLVLGVAIGFAGCGDDDDKTDAPVESSVCLLYTSPRPRD